MSCYRSIDTLCTLSALVSGWVIECAHLNISTERKVLPEGVSLEAVVGEDPPEVRVVREEHTKHVPDLKKTAMPSMMQLLLAGL